MESPIEEDIFLEAYFYDPLPSRHHIRYLVLEPGEGEDPLQCSLYESMLDEMPFFEAISYVWGSSERHIPISCDGGVIYITNNLRDVLRQVRYTHQSRTLWADSICINQQDNVEKGFTVAMMGQLYSKADRVLICLGLDNVTEASQQVASLIADVDSMIRKELAHIEGTWDTFPFINDDDSICSDERWMALRELMEEPWFDRGWTIQEAGLANDARILWGNVEIHWFSLLRVNHWLRNRAEPLMRRWHLYNICELHTLSYKRRHKREAMTMRREGGLVDSLSLLDTVDMSRQLELSDHRDRVYAFLEFTDTSGYARSIVPDYAKSFYEVQLDLASKHTNSLGDASILRFVQHNEHTINDSSASWVPRWDISIYNTSLSYSSIKTPIESPRIEEEYPVITTEGHLQVRAAIIDKVRYASDKLHWVSTSISDVIAIWTAISDISDTTISCHYESPLEVFQRVLTADRSWNSTDIKHTSAYMLRLHEGTAPGGYGDITPAGLDNLRSNAADGDLRSYHANVRAYGHNRRVILTERGLYGLAPGIVQEGDLCGLIFGGTHTPFIIRETESPGYYKILGESYIACPSEDPDRGLVALGSPGDHCWVDWGIKEQDIKLC